MNIVQIGTCDGNDYVSKLVHSETEIGLLILVEPMNIHNENIISCYHDIENMYLENVAIVTEDQSEISFFYNINDGPLYEVSSVDKNHILKHGYSDDGIVELKVECMTLNNLFKKYKLKTIDFLFIDAEGIDDKIIKSIDFKEYNISKIYFEYLHIKDKDVYEFLSNMGYSVTHESEVGWSSLATKK